MKNLKLIPAVAALFITSFVACKKKDKETTPQQKLIGAWKESYSVDDVNNNKVMDDAQISPAYSAIITFSADGTGNIGTPFTTQPIYWSLINNNADLRVIIDDSGIQDTSVVHISTLSDNKLILMDDLYYNGTTTLTSWDVYEKQ